MNLELSVIIVNYNGLQFLEGCLNSLKEKLNGISHEIIIIDNNSKDASCTFIKENYKDVKLIESTVNYGFGKGNNEAVKQAIGKYLLLFNNDTILLDNINTAIKILEENKSIGVIGVNMLTAQKKYIPAAGNFPSFKNMLRFVKLLDLGLEFKTGIFLKEYYEVDWLCGSFLLLSRDTYNKIRGFDEDYFMYVEDVDFCKKIANKGLKRVFIPSLNYIHFVGFNRNKNNLLVNGYRIYLKKHYHGFSFYFISFILTLNSFVKKTKLFFLKD